MDVLVLIGRIVFVGIFAVSAMGHLTQTQGMAGYAGSKGVPSPSLAVLVTGLMLAAGSLMVLLGLWGDLGALLLLVFLVPTAVIMHGPWRAAADQKQAEQTHFLKDLSLAGAALMIFVLFAALGENLGLTITGPVFSLS